MWWHTQKPDVVFRRNGRVHLNRWGASVQSTTGSRGVRISGSNAGYTMFRGSVKGTGYPLHSPVSPSLPLQCVTVCHHISVGVLQKEQPPNTIAGSNSTRKKIDLSHECRNSNYILERNFSTNSDVAQKFLFGIEKLAVGFLTDAVCQNM